MDDNIYKYMSMYNPFGPKDGEYKKYQKLEFIRSNISDYNEEMVDEYSVTVGRIYKWLLLAIDTRIDDVNTRRARKEKQRMDREKAIENE
jgi:hypothetical protein